MTLAAAAVLPSAPLFVPGLAATLPDGVTTVCDAIDVVVERLPDYHSTVAVAAGEDWCLHGSAEVDLAGIGRPDITRESRLDEALLAQLTGELDWSVVGGPLPLDLAVLTLLLGKPPPLVGLTVPTTASFAELAAAGRKVAEILTDGDTERLIVVSGDLSGGLDERAPLHAVEGAVEFDARVVDAVDASRLDALERLGPELALKVGARGWAPLALLHGILQHSKLGLVRRIYAAPRGVGYLVAYGA